MNLSKTILAIVIILKIIIPPSSYAQDWKWQNLLPTGNKLRCIEFVDSLNGWFGSSAGTILHTIDGGENWEIQSTGIENLYCHSIDFIDKNEGWAVGNPDWGPSYILHTTDGGNGWEIQYIDSTNIFSFIKFYNQKYGWAGAETWGKIFYTNDSGTTWEQSHIEETNYSGLVTSIVFFDTLYGLAEGWNMPLLYSKDGGKSWIPDTTGIVGSKVFFVDSLHGWISSREKVIRTIDGGNTWLDDLPKITDDFLSDVFFVDTLAGWVTSDAALEGIFRTIDGGRTWEMINEDRPNMDNDPYLFFTSNSGWIDFYRTRDGGKTLIDQKSGFTLDNISDVDFVNENTGWVVGWDGLIGKTIDGGNSWRLQESGIISRLNSIVALNEKIVWIVGWSGIILHTSDGGETWNTQYYKPNDSGNANFSITFTDSLQGWIVGGNFDIGGWVLHTQNGGETWIKQNIDILPRLFDVTFVTETNGWAAGSSTIYHTSDKGKTWTAQLTNQENGFNSVFFLDDSIGWACGGNWIVHTEDGGENWIVQSEEIEIYPHDIFFIDENKGWTCGIIGKIFYTIDGGETWNRQYSGTSQSLESIQFISGNTGWAVGWNGTILNTTTGGISNVKDFFSSNYIDHGFHLYSNYPNPFNSQTVISYELYSAGHVKLNIFNILGKEVITLINEAQLPGINKIVWQGKDKNGENVLSGIYFYCIQLNNNFQKTGKMVVIR